MKVALLPAKPLALAKTRLAPLLPDAVRARVAAAMFLDVLHALTAARTIEVVVVVTADPTLESHARRAGAVVVDEGTPRGLNGAVALGTDAAVRLGAANTLVVLSDVPLVRAADVDDLLQRAPTHGALVVPSKEGTGTNALLRTPPTAFPPCFGGRSLERHVAAAERAGLPCAIVRTARLELDLDTPEDLSAFVGTPSPTETYRELTRLGSPMRRIGARA
ncbi:MAG: 2-phospho-L-lactate guanylyltransferase [Deltaproteobacteria bacterium]|nr:2-phospho-L-lactate guanylyltransferase [Deltaproteobacteria bacterium]